MEIKVVIPKEQVQKLILLAYQIASAKQGSYWYQKDSHALVERYTRGLCGEQAVEYYLETPVVEWVADKKGHAHPDIQAYYMGVKTYREGMPAIVERKQTYPQVFCKCDEEVIDGTKDIEVSIMGVGMPDVVMANLDDKQVRDWRILRKKTKSAFVGYDKLIDLDEYMRQYFIRIID